MSTDPDLSIHLDAGELHLNTASARHLVADEIHNPGDVLAALRTHQLSLYGAADLLFGDYPDPQPVTHPHPDQLLAHLPQLEDLP